MENNSERKWFGIQFPDGKWLAHSDGYRIVAETAEEMGQVLNRWNESRGESGGQVKDFLPAPSGLVLYS